MSENRNPFQCSPELLQHLKDHASPCPSPYLVITRLISGTDDPVTRCMTAAALVTTLAQLAGPVAIKRPPGCLLVNAGPSSADPLNHVMRLLTGFSDPQPTASPEERAQSRNWMARLASEVIGTQKARQLTPGYLGPRMVEFRNARSRAFGGDRFGLYAEYHDELLGWPCSKIKDSMGLPKANATDAAVCRNAFWGHSSAVSGGVVGLSMSDQIFQPAFALTAFSLRCQFVGVTESFIG